MDTKRSQNGHKKTSTRFHFAPMKENELKPLVTFKNHRIQFNEIIARETFANEKFSDKKITLVSVMGPSRSGKSFLMSILTGGRQGNTVRGAFKTGYERCTEGILVFTQPMISEDVSET
ncbi:unnamed protein product, partial [Mesorhabditis belari]|uniref:GB1/RHD3-type G domain-containing protein n=1 Tax=Mesorhabditis belari TaxID=2138241 RepID=A0AAF3F961_9BILA